MNDDASADAKLAHMQDILRSLKRVAVAFSAGVDSTFVLKVAADTLGAENVLAVTAKSESLPGAEFDQARQLADSIGVELVVIQTNEFDNPLYLTNPVDRCYHCKNDLYEKIAKLAADRGFRAILSGTNADDYADYRPGMRAAHEHDVHSPCAEAGMSKSDIRTLSRQLGLPTHDKPAMPCLASRVPYGQPITPEKMHQIDQAETYLRSLGFEPCRVRHHGNMARIELAAEDIQQATEPQNRNKIDAAFRKLGFNYVAIDLRGFRTGSLNEILNPKSPDG